MHSDLHCSFPFLLLILYLYDFPYESFFYDAGLLRIWQWYWLVFWYQWFLVFICSIYRSVAEGGKATEQPIQENEIWITNKCRMRNYITYAMTLLEVLTNDYPSAHVMVHGLSILLEISNAFQLNVRFFKVILNFWQRYR